MYVSGDSSHSQLCYSWISGKGKEHPVGVFSVLALGFALALVVFGFAALAFRFFSSGMVFPPLFMGVIALIYGSIAESEGLSTEKPENLCLGEKGMENQKFQGMIIRKIGKRTSGNGQENRD